MFGSANASQFIGHLVESRARTASIRAAGHGNKGQDQLALQEPRRVLARSRNTRCARVRGANHASPRDDASSFKDNHIASEGGIAQAVAASPERLTAIR